MIVRVMVAFDRIPEALCDEIRSAFPGRRLLGAWLYGSRATGESRADSDVDVAVLCDAPLDPVPLFDSAGRLAARLGTAVDLVDLRRAGGLLRVEATSRGRPLVPPTIEANFLTTHALADHASFAANRRAATAMLRERFRAR
jgi:predicted nucleotidyltransferase